MTGSGDAAIRELVTSNPGQGTFEEYKLVYDIVLERAPCALLVFGVGRDSALWLEANRGGTTVFLEDVREWADFARANVPGIVVHDVRYRARRFMWPLLRHAPGLLRMKDLPPEVESRAWDVILVDAPRGTRWYRAGRMKSIFTASALAEGGGTVDVFVHDCHRAVERAAADRFLRPERLVGQAGTMRRYRFG
jgi:glucuronoxylan 4-O-methyltransferase